MTFVYYEQQPDIPMEYKGTLGTVWDLQQMRYASMWDLYTGRYWRQRDPNNAYQRKYKLGVNDIAMACSMHAQLVYGEVRDSSDPLVPFRVEARKGQNVDESIIENAQDFLDELWGESLSRKSQFLGALISQVTGGIFWRVRYETRKSPFDLYPFKFEPIAPDFVFPVFSSTNLGLFSEVFVRYKLSRYAARNQWGKDDKDWPDTVEYREHWTVDWLDIKVGVEGSWKQIKAERNPFGIVPFTYIPHVPSDLFYGIPLAEWGGADDLSIEFNSKLANTGAIVTQNAYPFFTVSGLATPLDKLQKPMRLFPGGPQGVNLGPRLPDGDHPQLEWFKASELTNAYQVYLDNLKKELRLAMAIPPVAVGEDEGSQRSSLTLLTRFFPFRSHVQTERWLSTPEYSKLNRMALHMGGIKRQEGLMGIDVSKIAVVPDWAPMMPRDRVELVNELVQRQAIGHIDPENALEQYGDIAQSEIDEVLQDIKTYKEWEADLQQSAFQNQNGVPVTPVGAKNE